MRYLTLSEVLDLYRLVMEQSGGAMGIRDLGALESALAQPRMTLRRFQKLNYPNCSRRIAKSGGPGLDLAIQAERSGAIIFLETPNVPRCRLMRLRRRCLMNRMGDKPNFPKSESLRTHDVWEDYLSLKRALADHDEVVASVPVSSGTLTLVQELIEAGVCQSEAEVISRAVRSFFVAAFPREPERQRVLQEATAEYRTR